MPAAVPVAIAAFNAAAAWASANVLLTTVIVTAASVGASYLLRPDIPSPGKAATLAQQSKIAVKQSIPRQRTIYGKVTTSGAFFFYDKAPPYLVIGYLLAAHRCDFIEHVIVNGNAVSFNTSTGVATTSPYTDHLVISARLGTQTQARDPLIFHHFPDILSTFRQQGICTAVLSAKHGADQDEHEDLWGSQSFNPLFRVRGKPVYDPRQGSHVYGDPDTYEWTDNGPLCLLDNMLDTAYGRQLISQFSTDQIGAAADLADELITDRDGTTHKRFTINGIIDTSMRPYDVMQDMLSSMAGHITWIGGQHSIWPGYSREPDFTIDQSMLTGGFNYRAQQPRSKRVNTLRTEFISDEAREYQMTNGPIVKIGRTNLLPRSYFTPALGPSARAAFNNNANTDGLTVNVTTGTYSYIDDSTALTAASLTEAGSLALLMDNSGGGATAEMQFDGYSGPGRAYTFTAYVRSTTSPTGSNIQIGTTTLTAQNVAVTSSYTKVSILIPAGTTKGYPIFKVAAGHDLYIAQPMLEAASTAYTTWVPTTGVRATALLDDREYDQTIRLPFTAEAPRVQLLGKIYAGEQSLERALTMSTDLRAYRLTAEDVVRVQLDDFDYVNGIYKITSAKITDSNDEIVLSMVEFDKDVYDFDAAADDQDFSLRDTGAGGTPYGSGGFSINFPDAGSTT